MASNPPLPPGFTLDQSSVPPLPPGFTLDSGFDQPVRQAAPSVAPQPEPQQAPQFDANQFNPMYRGIRALGDVVGDVGSSALATPISGIAGLWAGAGNALGLTNTDPADVVESVGNAMTYQPRTPEGRAVTDFGTFLPRKYAQGANKAGEVTTDITGSPALGTAVNVGIQAAPAILLGARGGSSNLGRGMAGGKGRPAPAIANAERQAGLGRVPPTIEELSAQSKAAYQRASDAGVNIAPESFANLKNRVNVTLKKEGIDPTLHPQTTAALKRINETEGVVSLDQLETLRKIANDARGAGKADGRLAGKIVDDLDDYTENIGRKDITTGDPKGFAALQEARSLYSRKMKAEEIARLIKRAEISAPNFSASGFENALRTEFRNLAKNDKKMRRFTPEERAVIEKVARGGKAENALRMLGKFAPTGVISGTLGIAATTLTGGFGAALPAAGLAGRYAATRMTKANALRAEETMRRGPLQKARAKKNALLELAEQNQ